jgi:hypothetical protein
MQPSRLVKVLRQSAWQLAGGSVRSWFGLQLDLRAGLKLRRTECPGGLLRRGLCAALDGGAVGLLDGAQPGGDPGLAGGDGLAVAAAVGALGQAAAGPLDLTDVGLSLVGVRGDGEHGDVGGGGVQDEADRLGLGVAAGQGQDPGTVGLGPGLLRVDTAVPDPVVELGEFDVGTVDLVADGGEVLADRAELGAPVVAVPQEPGGVRLVGKAAGAGVFAQLGGIVKTCGSRSFSDRRLLSNRLQVRELSMAAR